MATDKEMANYLKKEKLMPKAYVINWYINDLYRKDKAAWLADGTLFGYIRKNCGNTSVDYLKPFIDINYNQAKIQFDEAKKRKRFFEFYNFN